ncbi:hypothetical protein HPP92_027508 [Vanilla planifolia]|uniref:26S proteasome non-ATPase regulatory subunit 1/RPN2 N-terminal domain-containing protein n=1 Tax=Vanilla planifolia TaxID=51239 RepID=A0A835PAU7_VANPL|nr:hypothetical protein HPP92_027508 [Vanilla planifolia]
MRAKLSCSTRGDRRLLPKKSSFTFRLPFIPPSEPDLNDPRKLYETRNLNKASCCVCCFKVFYYLGELNDSLSYALGAGPLFDVSEDSDYAHTLLAKALDEYASLRAKNAKSNEVASAIDPRLEAIVERMLDKCISDGKYQQAMGYRCESN